MRPGHHLHLHMPPSTCGRWHTTFNIYTGHIQPVFFPVTPTLYWKKKLLNQAFITRTVLRVALTLLALSAVRNNLNSTARLCPFGWHSLSHISLHMTCCIF